MPGLKGSTVLLSTDGWVAPRTAGGRDLYLFAHGLDYRAALADYHRLTGPVPLVPRFVLGNWFLAYDASRICDDGTVSHVFQYTTSPTSPSAAMARCAGCSPGSPADCR